MSNSKFVILTSSRTGSTWLVDLLNSRPGIDAHGELFLEEPRRSPSIATREDFPRYVQARYEKDCRRPARVYRFLDELYAGRSITGFKLMYTQLKKYPEIGVYIRSRNVNVVHLVRRNLLDVLVSEELAKLTGTSHASHETQVKTPKVALDIKGLLPRLERRQRRVLVIKWALMTLGFSYIEVAYEDLLEDKMTFAKILKHLNVAETSGPYHTRLVKRGLSLHHDAICNIEEVRGLLKGSRYEWMVRTGEQGDEYE